MRRREFITLSAGSALVWSLAVRGQEAKVPRVAVVAAGPPVSQFVSGPVGKAIVEGLRALGYVEGRNLLLEWRSAEGKYERFPEIYRELVSTNVDVIIPLTTPGVRAAKQVVQTIPIVMVGITDPVGEGFVQSLARPGGNITGSTDATGPENIEKQLQLLKELLPTITRVACLWLGSQTQREEGKSIEAAARKLGVEILFAEHSASDFSGAFALIARERPDAIFVAPTGAAFANRRLIAEFATAHRLPTIFHMRDFAELGGFIGYGTSLKDLWLRAARQVDMILKGSKPSEMPVEQPTKFELVINLKTAKALGLTIPPSLLARADEVIE